MFNAGFPAKIINFRKDVKNENESKKQNKRTCIEEDPFFTYCFHVINRIFLCAGPVSVTAESIEITVDWDINNTVSVEIKSEYVDYIFGDISGAFASLDLKDVYITNKYETEGKHLHLLLVLNEGGDAQQDAAVAQLLQDSRIKTAQKSCDAPFETVNTLQLTASAHTVKVGDTLTVKPEDTLKVYQPSISYDKVSVMLANYDSEKEYTLLDFPYFDFVSMEKIEFNNIGSAVFYLTLSQPEYYNVYKAITALALDPNIQSVQPDFLLYPAVVLNPA